VRKNFSTPLELPDTQQKYFMTHWKPCNVG